MVDSSVLDIQYPFVLAYLQPPLEELLERYARDLAATMLRGYTVTDVSPGRVAGAGPGR
jgi:hypothetical protein